MTAVHVFVAAARVWVCIDASVWNKLIVDVRKGGADYSGHCLTEVPLQFQISKKKKIPLTKSNGFGGEPSVHHDPKATEGESIWKPQAMTSFVSEFIYFDDLKKLENCNS